MHPMNIKNIPKYKLKNAFVEISASVQFVTNDIKAPITPQVTVLATIGQIVEDFWFT
jgi:hypothetical protein